VLFEEHRRLAKSKEKSKEAKEDTISCMTVLINPSLATKAQRTFLSHKNKELV